MRRIARFPTRSQTGGGGIRLAARRANGVAEELLPGKGRSFFARSKELRGPGPFDGRLNLIAPEALLFAFVLIHNASLKREPLAPMRGLRGGQ